jgi:hypothetical protein
LAGKVLPGLHDGAVDLVIGLHLDDDVSRLTPKLSLATPAPRYATGIAR